MTSPTSPHVGMAAMLPADARIGRVQLRVSDLARALGFYRDLLGLRPVREAAGTATLAAGERELLVLREVPGLARRPRRPATTGLYHVAFLVPDRGALGRALLGLQAAGYPLRGASDHLVSESLYLDDPDGNGLEIYADRPRGEWRWENGMVTMAVDPMDVGGVVAAAGANPGPWAGLPAGTVVGHVHFTVRDVDGAAAFYHDVVGFDLVARLPGLVGVSAGGYHHHLNLNGWAGHNPPPDDPAVAGLDWWELRVDDPAARAALAGRLAAAGAAATGAGAVPDPDGVPMAVVGG